MKKNLYLIATVLVLFTCLPARGQFLNKLQKQIERKSEEHALKEADKAADKGLDKAADAIWKSIEEQEKENSGDTTSSGSGNAGHQAGFPFSVNSGEPVPVEDQYTFDTRVAYQFSAENPDNKQEEAIMDMISWYGEGKEYSATRIKVSQNEQPLNVLTIFDLKNEAMIVIMEDQKMAQVMSTKEMNVEEESSADDSNVPVDKPEIKKTGRTKKILGYTCYEYEMKDKDTEGTFWIAPDAKVYSAGLFKGGVFGKDSPDIILPEDQQGMLMEMNAVVTNEDGEKSNIKLVVKSIDKKSMTINMADYQKMNLGMH